VRERLVDGEREGICFDYGAEGIPPSGLWPRASTPRCLHFAEAFSMQCPFPGKDALLRSASAHAALVEAVDR